MSQSDRLLQRTLTFQGLFYLAVNLWALIATPHFLGMANPGADVFEARSFAAVSLVISIFFLVGAWRQDLLRPAAFLGLGMAVAITLVELFHLPELGLRTVLWIDLAVEIVMAGLFIFLFFFRRDEHPVQAGAVVTEPAGAEPEPTEPSADRHPEHPDMTIPAALEPITREEGQSPEEHVV